MSLNNKNNKNSYYNSGKREYNKKRKDLLFLNDKNAIKEKVLAQMLHEENSELGLDLIEWEDDGKGNFISK